MRQHVEPSVGRHLRRHAHHQLRVKHRRGRQQAVIDHRVFDILLMIRDDGEAAHLRPGAARRRDRREGTRGDSPLLMREKDDRLCRVDRRTAAKHDHMVRLELNDARRTRGDGLDIWVRLHVGEYLILRARSLQIIGDVRDLAARNHKRVGDDKDTPRTTYRVRQRIFSHIYSGNRRKLFHNLPP